MIAAAKAKKRRRLAREVRVHELASGAIVQLDRLAALGVDQLDVDPFRRGEMHSRLGWAFAPQRRGDVPEAHDLVNLGGPCALERAGRALLRAARLAAGA